MNTGKTFRHGQILRLISDASIANQEELRRRLAAQKLRVTQATLSRDLQELRLVKTHEGYKAYSIAGRLQRIAVTGTRPGRISP
jgi:transcriptional regulator of arginine metabolism